MHNTAIQVKGLQKSYKQLQVLKGVDFEVERGSVFALLGYELVEGRIGRRGIREVDRANMLELVTGRRRGVVWKDL